MPRRTEVNPVDLRPYELKRMERRLGGAATWGTWCEIGRIPPPPAEVRAAAGGGRLRPGFIRPHVLLGYLLVAPVILLGVAVPLAFALLGAALEAVHRAFSATARGTARHEKEQQREKESRHQEKEENDAAELTAHRLDETFDGDWSGRAGQLLLRWYGMSSYPRRLLLRTDTHLVIAGPRRRVATGSLRKSRVLERIPLEEVAVETPLPGRTTVNRLRFQDGSWLVLTRVQDEGLLGRLSF
ncbi:hypothetical protein HUT19_37155 [Streptomyces sp. NA02950]|uniref:hypothetical protein n=1 Tax=Streptomyces sp. NA02950 TaxID=2742137 RepID=UPI001591AD2B|nr:hypothetical protein [Streptomyces sp. NA02950]QKV96639.1 hypothetical protein HUT19_37155 [Streptomyces sp. NA02950]